MLLVPVAVLINVWLAYPLVFLITTISIFFRPARQAMLPRIVPEDDLLSANSAMWVGETLADVVNYPIAGLFVVFLAASLAARVLVRCRDLPRRRRSCWRRSSSRRSPSARARPRRRTPRPPEERMAAGARTPSRRCSTDLKAGWAFLRHETVLLANTLQGTAGQFSLGVLTVASLILAREITTTGGPGRVPGDVRVHGDGDRRRQPDRRVHAGRHRGPGPEGHA